MTQLTIGTRLALSFLIVLGLMFLGILLGRAQTGEVRAQAQNLQMDLQLLQATTRVYSDLLRMQAELPPIAAAQDALAFREKADELAEILSEDIQEVQSLARQQVRGENNSKASFKNGLVVQQFSFTLHPMEMWGQHLETFLLNGIDPLKVSARLGHWDEVQAGLRDDLGREVSAAAEQVAMGTLEWEYQQKSAASSMQNAQSGSRSTFLITSLLSLLAAALLGVVVTRSISRPLDRLNLGAKALARGEFWHRIPVHGHDELSHLGRSFNQTAANLETLYAEVDKRVRQLEHLDHVRADFIRVASHELRTPLTVLRGYSQMLQYDRRIQSDESLCQLVEGIHSGSERLQEIVDSMLDIAKIDSRSLELNPEPLALKGLLRNVWVRFEDVCKQRHIEFRLEDVSALPPVEADEMALFKAFSHIVGNAIKYTPDEGSITIRGRALEPSLPELPYGGAEIVVSDTGIGIDPQFQELIFTKFYQTGELAQHSSGSTKFKGGGPGLGLAIARGILQAHGGKVWVESPGYDEAQCPGSQFHVVLPAWHRATKEAPES